MKKIINKIDWVLFAILLFAALTPLLYKGYRLFLVSHMESESLSIAINWGYIYMIFESVNIFVIVPSYWFIRRNAETMEESNRNLIIILLFTCVAFFISIGMVALLGLPIAQSSYSDAGGTVTFMYVYGYILSYGFTLSLHLFINVMVVYMIVHNKKLQAFLITLLTMVVVMLTDTLLLTDNINPNAGLMAISESMLISSLISLVVISISVYFVDSKSWNNSFKLVTKDNLFEGWKVYAKNGMWLGLEAFSWNMLNALGVFTWFLVCQDDSVETAFWIMDGLFWGFLLLPATAVTMFTAEGISNEETVEGKKDVVKVSIFLSCLTIFSWLILVPVLVFFAIPGLLAEPAEVIEMAQKMCWVFVAFIAIQVPTKVIYTYFSTTNRSFYLTAGTVLGASLTWGLSFITLLILNFSGLLDGGISNEIAVIIIPIIYGLGILFIFVFYMVFFILTMNDTEETPGLMQRWKMKNELIKATVTSDI